MPGIMKRNLTYKLISLLLALILWAYVTNEQNPISKHTYDIPLEAKGLKSGLAILDLPKSIKVTVENSKLSFSSSAPENIQAYVDLSDISQVGEAICPVEIKQDGNVNIIESKPDNVKVSIDYINSKSYDINFKPIGKLDNQYYISKSKISPARIIITGPQSLLDKIGSVIVSPEINNLKGKQDINLPLRVIDQEGKLLILDNLKLSQERAAVSFQVDKVGIELEKPIKPQLVGQAADGFYIESISISPKTAILAGELLDLNGIDFIKTEKIDITGKSKDYNIMINLQQPEKTKLKGNGKVNVTVGIKPLNTQKLLKEKISVRNLPSGMTAKLDFAEVNILVSGTKDDLKNVVINPWIDLKGYTGGEYQVKIRTAVPKDITISNIAPQYVKVIIE